MQRNMFSTIKTVTLAPHFSLLKQSAFNTQKHTRRMSKWQRKSTRASSSNQDEVLRSISDNGQVSILVVRGTHLVQEAITRHQAAPTAAAALGRALLGSLLMSCFRGEGEKTQVTFRGDGPLGSVQIIADASGMVKGKVGNPLLNLPLRSDGKLNVGGAVGRGILAVVRSLPFTEQGWQQPYTGMVPIKSGEIAEDLAAYLVDSEQSQSALGLGVSINKNLECDAAGGFLIQVLPFAEDSTIELLERNILSLGSVSSLLKQGLTPRDITEKLLEGLGVSDGGFSLKPEYGPCESSALRGRMASAVAALGEEEVNDIIKEQGHIEVTCEFCRETYQFKEKEIMEMIEEGKSS